MKTLRRADGKKVVKKWLLLQRGQVSTIYIWHVHRKFQVGRALRAVDSRLKWEWVQWAENGLLRKDIQSEGRRQELERGFTDEATNDAEVGSTGTATWSTEQENAAAVPGQRRSSHQEQRRRLRAWCIKVRERKAMRVFFRTQQSSSTVSELRNWKMHPADAA